MGELNYRPVGQITLDTTCKWKYTFPKGVDLRPEINLITGD